MMMMYTLAVSVLPQTILGSDGCMTYLEGVGERKTGLISLAEAFHKGVLLDSEDFSRWESHEGCHSSSELPPSADIGDWY